MSILPLMFLYTIGSIHAEDAGFLSRMLTENSDFADFGDQTVK